MANVAFPEGVKGTLKKVCLDTTWEHTVAQVQAYLKHKQSKTGVGFKVRGLVQDIIDVCIKTPLTIPADYVTHSDYKLAQEFADALGMDINQMCLMHLGSGEMLNMLLFIINKMNEELLPENRNNENKAAKRHVRSTIMVSSHFTLF
jgi:hypothetical protein